MTRRKFYAASYLARFVPGLPCYPATDWVDEVVFFYSKQARDEYVAESPNWRRRLKATTARKLRCRGY